MGILSTIRDENNALSKNAQNINNKKKDQNFEKIPKKQSQDIFNSDNSGW